VRSERLIARAAVATLSPLAAAQPLTGLFEWHVSADGGTSWSSAIAVNPGDPYRIRGIASWTDGPVQSIGFGGCTFEQIDLIGADSSDRFGGASGPGGTPTIAFRLYPLTTIIWLLHEGTGASAGGLKLDRDDPAGRIDFGQLPKLTDPLPNPDFSAANPIRVFELDAIAGGPKQLTISGTWQFTGEPLQPQFRVYTTETGTNKRPIQAATQTVATVTITPSPPALALALLAIRRQRRSP